MYSVWEWHWSSPLFFFVIVTYTVSHFLLSLSPFHSCTTTAPHLPLLSLSQQWSMILSIHCNAPHRRAILAICLHRDSLLFLLNVPTAGKMTRTKCVMSICTEKEKQWRITGTDCLTDLSETAPHTYFVTKIQWTVQFSNLCMFIVLALSVGVIATVA